MQEVFQSHRDLKIYQRSYAISLEIYKETKNFPKEEQFGITSQIRRASSGICANIAEGYGRQLSSNADFKRFLIIAKGSCHEMDVWLDFCIDMSFVDPELANKWKTEYLEISKMLFAFINKLKT